ncbi:MAG: hypothetical protein RIB53_18235 [Roseitalea porphyridii]|jgi:hypothetical protein|uniref:hypothetical protein n=1 Tax=Roseitalea porphyridii TaxID=1852022 RepID=UPI0032F05A66
MARLPHWHGNLPIDCAHCPIIVQKRASFAAIGGKLLPFRHRSPAFSAFSVVASPARNLAWHLHEEGQLNRSEASQR